ncbi:MAG: CsgG/HfaB family protein [Bdellovibrionia bacterium]
MMANWISVSGFCVMLLFSGCATESFRNVEVKQSQSFQTARSYSGPKSPIVVGHFDNHSNYMRGLFTEGPDLLRNQAKTLLMAHLQRTGRFSVMDRDHASQMSNEAQLKGQTQKIKAGDFIITGDVTEFGRKETGDRQLFGILGSGRSQIAYSKVTLQVVDVLTSEVVFSVSGAGEYALSDREVIGFGGRSGYDSTLNGKVLDLALREAVDRLVEGLEQGHWSPSRS